MSGNLGFALDGAWRVLSIALLLGAGLPLVFALGIRGLALGSGGDAEVSHAAPRPVGRVLAVACFAVVLAGVALGLTIIVASGFAHTVSFEHVYPTLVPKG